MSYEWELVIKYIQYLIRWVDVLPISLFLLVIVNEMLQRSDINTGEEWRLYEY